MSPDPGQIAAAEQRYMQSRKTIAEVVGGIREFLALGNPDPVLVVESLWRRMLDEVPAPRLANALVVALVEAARAEMDADIEKLAREAFKDVP